jgi:hypothetical protein
MAASLRVLLPMFNAAKKLGAAEPIAFRPFLQEGVGFRAGPSPRRG